MLNFFSKNNFFNLILAFLLILYTVIAIKFVWHCNLSSFSSDSVNYMIMALNLSPWKEASNPIQLQWEHQDFPPIFPFLLAYTGVAHNLAAAHILTLALLIFSLPLIYLFAKECGLLRWQAVFVVSIFAISPSTWINILGILSENLYILLSFLILLVFNNRNLQFKGIALVLGLLLSILLLTRTIGVAMLIAYVCAGFKLYKDGVINKINYFLPILVSTILTGTIKLLYQPSVPSQYIRQVKDLNIENQFIAIYEAWFTAWQLYWVEGLMFPYVIIFITGLLACFGLLYRFSKFKIDAIYVAIYLAILLIWPHPGQALRFMFPIQVLLLIYAFYSITILFDRFSITLKYKFAIIQSLLLVFVVLPPLSFIYNRFNIGSDNNYNHVTEFYRTPDLQQALNNASTQITMINDMKMIKEETNKDSIILYFYSSYIALLSNRKGIDIIFNEKGNNSFEVTNTKEADYIYLSKIHPRKAREGVNGLSTLKYFMDDSEILWKHYSKESNELVSVFLKVNK